MTASLKNVPLFYAINVVVGILCSLTATGAKADITTAKNWLTKSPITNSQIANPLQTQEEVALTLSHLQTNVTLEQLNTSVENETSTEGLVRLILIAKAKNQPLPIAWQNLVLNQNEDGGFGHIEGWQSNPLDTAYVLIALQESGYLTSLDKPAQAQWQANIAKALDYLASQQQSDGGYKIAYLDDLYINSYVLSAFTPYLKQYGQYLPVAQKLVSTLQSKQTSAGTWSSRANNTGLFIDALVAESLYPYQSSDKADSFKTNFTNRVLALQNADGSWQQDAYVTAVVLRSLDTLAKPATNPITSGISLSVIDAESGIALTDAVLTANGVKVSSDSSGNVIVNDAQAGTYQFTLTRAGYAPVNFTVNLQQGEQLNLGQIRLSRSASIETAQIQGTVTDKTTQAPITNATVTVVLVNETGGQLVDFEPIIATTDAKGRYQVVLTKEQLAASKGKFNVHVASQGYNEISGSGMVQAGGVAMFSPTLTSVAAFNASLIGKIIDETGQPLVGATLNYQGKSVATTDSTGAFVVNNLPMGSGQWQIELAGYQSATLSLVVDQSIAYNAGTITLPKVKLTDPNNPNSQPLPATQGSFIVAPMDSRSNQPLTNFTVKFEKLDSNNTVIQTQSFATNEAQVNQLTANLPVGKWRITISHPAYQTSSQVFDLADKASINYKPPMVLTPYAVTGTVVDSLTNQPISNAPIKVVNSTTKAVLFTGQTDIKGQFTAPSNLTADEVQVEVTPPMYLATTRYINRDYETPTAINLGEIRLRPKSAEVVLPDLTISKTDISKLVTNSQTLNLTGEIGLTIDNKGNAELIAKPTTITAFVDTNHNHKLDTQEQVVARKTQDISLASGKSIDVSLNLSGKLNFRDAPIAVMVDSDNQIAESNENNNVRLTSDGVEIKPKQGTLEAETRWMYGYTENDVSRPSNWSSFGSSASPVAAPLNDTNGDGKIGEGDIATIIYNNYFGKMVAINGLDGKELWSVSVSSQYNSPAIADIDNDNIPDIIVLDGSNINIYSNKGILKKSWRVTDSTNFYVNDIIISDLNADKIPEIIVGSSISNYEKGLILQGERSVHAVADLDNDGLQELITTAGVYKLVVDKNNIIQKMEKIFEYPPINFVSVADVTGDGKPNIVTTGNGYFTIYDNEGKQLAKYDIPTGGYGGVPTLADFDGDGIADMGVAGSSAYTVMRSDGSIIWSKRTQDTSSHVTGSSIFDFNNDGKSEVVYGDEDYFRIYDAQTGNVIYELINSSHTAHEAPIVVDADADGHADVIFVSNTSGGGGHGKTAGVRMISSKNKDWANTRNIWNQYSYHVTNINDDLTVPTKEPNSWEVHNTYRANLLLNQNATAATDLTTSYLQIKDNGAAPSQFSARIGNAGGKTAPAGTPVSFYQKDSTGQTKLLGVVKLPKDLASDEYIDLNLDYSPLTGTLNGFGELIVVANDAGAGIDSATGIPNLTDPNAPVNNQGVIQEYSRANNLASISITGDFAGFSLSGSLDKTSYTANDTVKISSIATNLGSFATTPTLKVSIIDSAGNVVTTYPEQVVKLGVAMAGQPIGDENSTTVQNFWNTSQQRIGNYTAHIELINNNQTVGSVDKPFAIVADGVKTGQVDSQLAVDKTQYNTTDLVQIHSRLINTASNAMATARNVVLTVKDATGQQIWTQSYNYSELAPNVIKDQYFTVPLKNAPSGSYSVTSTTTAPDGTQTTQTLNKAFEVLSAAQTGINVTGTIQAPTSVSIGQEMPLDWTISNNNAQAITNLPVAIALYRNDETTPFATIPANGLTLDANGKITGNSKWLSAGNENDKITAVLTATFGSTTKGLATTTFNLVQTPIKVDFSNHSTAKNDTLLVYYACEDGWYTSLNNSGAGKFDYPCFNERENTIRSYLDRMGVNYKLVKTPWDFRHELQSGIYGQYWLLGAIENLSPHLYNEVVELSNTGQNILFDSGTHSWLNQDLYKLANVKYNGRLLLETGEILPNPTYFPAVADSEIANSKLSTQTKLAGQPFNSNWAIMLEPKSSSNQSLATFSGSPKQVFGINQSNYPNQSYNAITAATYGNGVPVVAAFDLISSLDFANKTALPPYKNNASTLQLHWDSVLNQLLIPRRIAPRSDYAPSEPVSIPMSLQNPSDTDKRIQVDVILPQGSQWLGYQGGISTPVSNALDQHYQVTLKPGQTLQDILMVRLPNIAGTHGVKITVSDITDSSQPIKLDQLEARFLVRDIASRVALLKQTIQKWSSVGTNGLQSTNAKVKISLIQTHLSTGVDELAVYEAGNLAHIISDMQPTATQDTVAIRYEVDELLRALQIKWYLARNGKTPLP